MGRSLTSLNFSKLPFQQGLEADRGRWGELPSGTDAEACLEAGGPGGVWRLELADPSQGKESRKECWDEGLNQPVKFRDLQLHHSSQETRNNTVLGQQNCFKRITAF